MGELDGRTTPRLKQIAEAFESAGLPVTFNPNMDAWLKTHVALILSIGGALYMAGGDNYRLARTRDALVLMVRQAARR
jgi:2-dehydropantoate 2-reductase